MSDSTPSTTPTLSAEEVAAKINQLDTDTNKLGVLERRALELLLEAAGKHQEIDEEYSPRINSLLHQIQEQFGSLVPLAEALRSHILDKDKKTADRLTGSHSWKSSYSVGYLLPEEQIIANIKALGRGFSGRLLRTVPCRVLDKNAIKLKDNKELVAQIEGLEPIVSEAYYVTPASVFTMTGSRDVTKFMGIPLPALLKELLRNPEA